MTENKQAKVEKDVTREVVQKVEDETLKEKRSVAVDAADVEKNKGIAILSYFVFFLPMLTEAKDSKFAMFHANQSLIVLLMGLGFFIVGSIIPVIGWFIIIPGGMLFTIVLFIMGIVNAANGKMQPLPLVGDIHILDK